MRDRDYTPATEFLESFFAGCEHAIEIRALPNIFGENHPVSRMVNDPQIVLDMCARLDGPGRGIFVAMATRLKGSHSGKREDIAELPGLWVDVDCYKLGITKEEAVAALRLCPLVPTVITDSGGGVHGFWCFREPLDVRLTEGDDDAVKEEVDAALKALAGVFAGDLLVCQVSAVMRLPGSHNTKTGELRHVHIIEASGVRHEFGDLVEMLDQLRPLIKMPEAMAGPKPADDNPFAAFASLYGFKAPMDVEQALAGMRHLSGETGIHWTQLRVSASMVQQGADDDAIVTLLINETRLAAYPYGERWNWKREERNIRRMIADARVKYVKADKERPLPQTIDQEASAAAEIPAEAPKAAVSGGTVVSLATERRARKAKGSADGDDKPPMIARAGRAVIDYWQSARGQIAVVDGKPHTYKAGVWIAWTGADEHALKAAIQGILAAGAIEPKTQLLNAVYRYVVEHPDLLREGVAWDESEYIVCLDGAIHPLTREVVPHSPDHWATASIQVNIADMSHGCPRWLEFLDGCFSDIEIVARSQVIANIAEWMGAAWVRVKARELRKCLWLYGDSRTGKTRLLDVFRLLIGEPICALKLRELEKNFGGSALINKRAWIADDAVGPNDEVDDALFKVIVTGEAFSTNVKNQSYKTLRLNIPVAFSSNPLPRVKDQSDAVFNRALLIPMRVVRSEEETAGKSSIDEIVAREGELAGIFAWSLDAWANLYGRGRFVIPEVMAAASNEFKSSNNPVMAWAKTSLEAAPDWMIDRRDSYASFKGWYKAEFGETARVPSQKFLMSGLRQCMPLGSDEPKRDGYPQITGIKLTADGMTYRQESESELGVRIGSGASDNDVNKLRPARPEPRPTGRDPRF